MIRQPLRDLAGAFPLLTFIGSVAVCAAGLVSFDTSVALIRATPRGNQARTAGFIVPPPRVEAVLRRSGKTIRITPLSRRNLQSSDEGKSSSSRAPVIYEKSRCGDKLMMLKEECDDGNTVSGDGCSASCAVEKGFTCNRSQPSVCWSACADGIVATGKEECDDGNTANGDGCSQYCTIDPGYACTGEPSLCALKP